MNHYLQNRLSSLLDISKLVDESGSSLSSASKGNEREFFINHHLNNVIAPPFRIGTGDITDASGKKSGQCDIVIEYTSSISFPMIAPSSPRLYLAEGVCAVIEVKSDLERQWSEVEHSYKSLRELKREYGAGITFGGEIPPHVPYFVVGYRGWKKPETLKEKIRQSGVSGILILDSALYCDQGITASGVYAMFGFLIHLNALTGKMIGSAPNYNAYFANTGEQLNKGGVQPAVAYKNL